MYICDLLDEDNNVLSLQDINMKFNINMPFTIYYSIVGQVKQILKECEITQPLRPVIPNFLNIILSNRKGCKSIYKYLNKKNLPKPNHQLKWENILNLSVNQNWWNKHYPIVFKITKDSKLHWFQYRINYRILATNSYLHKIGYTDSDLCTFCQNERETIYHIFWGCTHVQTLWREFSRWISEKCSQNFILSAKDVILGKESLNDTKNLLIILIKMFIYKQRNEKCIPVFIAFLKFLKYYQRIEKIMYQNKREVNKFNDRWENLIID